MAENPTKNPDAPPPKVVVAPAQEFRQLYMSDLQGSAAEKIQSAVTANGAVIFGKTWCPFCMEACRLLNGLGADFAVYNIDAEADGSAVHAALKETYKQTTVPYVFIGGELLGGCSDLNQANADGKLEPMLRAAGCPPRKSAKARRVMNLGVLEGKASVPTTLFAFPEAVDDRVVRLTSLWTMIIAIIVPIFYDRRAAWFTMLGLMVDFVLRFLGGANAAPLGCLSTAVVALMEAFGSKPQFRPGPPKQFAALCGLMFSALSTLFFLTSVHEVALHWVGLAFSAALACAAAMEALAGFCLGCFFFGLMVQFGLMPKTVYQVYTTIAPEVQYTYDEMNKVVGEPEPERHTVHLLGKDTPLSIDYKYKAKSDDYTREDFNALKHVKIQHFMMHLSMCGVASAWKIASVTGVFGAPTAVYQAIALVAAVLYVVWAVLYLFKCALYPQKVAKEWQCPLRGNSFVLPFTCLVLFGFLVENESYGALVFGKVLFWIGAPVGLALSIIKVGDWLSTRKELEHVSAAWIIMPVQNFVAALVGPWLDANYRLPMQFWFAFAFVLWLLLFAVTFLKAVVQKPDDDRNRPLIAIWVAAPAVASVAYLECFRPAYRLYIAIDGAAGLRAGQVFDDFIFVNLVWISVSLTLVLLVGLYRPFFGRIKFDMAYWAAGFPTCALAFAVMFYLALFPGGLSQGIAIAGLAFASALNAMLLLQTLAAVLRFRVFVPDYKWGPLSFMRLTHEAFRGALPKLVGAARALVAAGPSADASLAEELTEAWRLMALCHEEHARHEDLAIFKTYNDFFPGVAGQWNQEHEDHHKVMEQIEGAVQMAASGRASPSLVSMLEDYAAEMEKHLRGEEDHLVGMPRKWLPLELHKQVMRKCWDMTPAPVWAEYIPWALNSLPMLQQRVRFLKTFLWAMPERAQHIGLMVACGVDDVQWRRISDELPEIIPRGASGWERYY